MLELLMPYPEIQLAFIATQIHPRAARPLRWLGAPAADSIEGLVSDLFKYETTADNSTGGDKVDCNAMTTSEAATIHLFVG